MVDVLRGAVCVESTSVSLAGAKTYPLGTKIQNYDQQTAPG